MKTRKIKFTAGLLSIVCAALIGGLASFVSAQILKPGEILYSRLPNDINAPPTGTNSPTIWAVGQDGSNDRLLTTGTAPRISDDGRFLLFKRFTRHPIFNPFGGNADIFVRELRSGQETLIFGLNFEQGSVGYYFSPESNQGAHEIVIDSDCFMYKANRDGTNLFRFPWASAPYCFDDFPAVRRGGDQRIAFHNLTNDAANGGLYTVGIDGANRQKIPNTACGDLIPAWSNDNQFVAYGALFEACANNFPQITYPYFVANLFKIKPDGTGKEQLTNLTNTNCRNADANCLAFGVVWNEDNSKIIAAGRINGAKGLFAFNANGGGLSTQIPISAGNAPDFVGGIVPPRVEQTVMSPGGGVSENGAYTLVSTVGEAVAGEFSGGGAFSLASGFWAASDREARKSPFDFDGDGKTDISIFRPAAGEWWYLKSSNGANTALQFGASTDRIAPADFTGDGRADIAFWRPANGFWFVLRSEDNSFFSVPFGVSGDVPVPADFDGDGKTDIAVFRPSDATWYISRSSGGTSIVAFGTGGDKPVPADYDGDGKTDIAIFRPSDGSWWYLRSSDAQFRVFRFGIGTDKAVPGDYSGDGRTDLAVFRESTGEWFIQRSEDGSYYSVPFGAFGDIPAPGDYDGDGKYDTAVFRPANATWFINRSSAGVGIVAFGATGDRTVPNAFID